MFSECSLFIRTKNMLFKLLQVKRQACLYQSLQTYISLVCKSVDYVMKGRLPIIVFWQR